MYTANMSRYMYIQAYTCIHSEYTIPLLFLIHVHVVYVCMWGGGGEDGTCSQSAYINSKEIN